MSAPISEQLRPINLHIEEILLDPNNPRFVTDSWIPIADESVHDDSVQADTRRKMEVLFNVEKLRINMEINGYLPIDRIVVRKCSLDKYVVLEGNRRVTAAKQIYELHQQHAGIDESVRHSLELIPCLEYFGSDTDAAWVFQGIRHITGIVDWSAYHKAKMLSDRRALGETLSEVGKRFGLTAFGAGAWIRGYKAFRQAKDESAFSREIDERIYPYFQDVFNRSNISLRKWLEWDEKEERFENDLNLNEFLSWFYPKEEPEDGRDINDVRGEWDKRIITTVHTLRDVSYLRTNSPGDFEQFLMNRDLSGAVALAKAKEAEDKLESEREPATKLLETMNALIRQLENIPMLKFNKAAELREELKSKLLKLEEVTKEVNDQLIE